MSQNAEIEECPPDCSACERERQPVPTRGEMHALIRRMDESQARLEAHLSHMEARAARLAEKWFPTRKPPGDEKLPDNLRDGDSA